VKGFYSIPQHPAPTEAVEVAGDQVPEGKVLGFAVVVAVHDSAARVVGDVGAEHRGGDEDRPVAEEPKDGGRPVERAVAGGEGGVGEDVAPGLADDGRAGESRGVIGWEAEEDLCDNVVHGGVWACAFAGGGATWWGGSSRRSGQRRVHVAQAQR
jgi:hypothetical protein